ncbi:MAG: hypothetical protein GYA86_06720 [Firmicutes bacterium]|nr:hypothetical protein [Bacillota bacterium]
MQRYGWVAYLFFTIAALSGLLYLYEQNQQQQQRYERLTQQIDDLQTVYEEAVQELTEVHDENRELIQDLEDALYRIETVRQRNTQLESILLNQRQTYRDAVGMRGASMTVLTRSHFTARQYERAWSRLGAGGLKGTGEALVRAEETYGVNSLVLAAIALLESGAGKSRLAREKNNLFGLGAGGADPYGSALSFSSREQCINYAARLLCNRYLSRGSRMYRGEDLSAVGPNYAADPEWAEKVSRHMSRIARAAIPGGI